MVSAVGDEQNREIQIRVKRSKDRQTRGARQPQAREGFPCLDLSQQLLILGKCAEFIEKMIH
jgi:hypothetical protein